METDLVSFVLRFRRDDADADVWRGRIVHVQSSAEQYFTSLDDAIHFMRARLAAGEATDGAAYTPKRARSRPAPRGARRRKVDDE